MKRIGSIWHMADTYTKRYRLWEWLVTSQQTVVCCIPTAKPEGFRHAETMIADKDATNKIQE